MSDEFEQAHEHLEHVAHGHNEKGHTRPAIIIAIMAAALALIEFAAKDAQTNYLTNHIAATNSWAQYEAKAVRRTVLTSEALDGSSALTFVIPSAVEGSAVLSTSICSG
jgi:Domain of unknown function (DUF4337)